MVVSKKKLIQVILLAQASSVHFFLLMWKLIFKTTDIIKINGKTFVENNTNIFAFM